MLVLSVPLYQPGVYSRMTGARHGQRAAQYRAQKVEHDVMAQVKSAWATFRTARERVHEYQKVVEASRNAFHGVRLEQRAGTRTVLDVLDAERDVLSANVSLVASEYESAAAQVDLAVAIGVFTIDNLRVSSSTDTESLETRAVIVPFETNPATK
jgi:outer membrane protein